MALPPPPQEKTMRVRTSTKNLRTSLKDFVFIDGPRLERLIAQVPSMLSIFEDAKAEFGISLIAAKASVKDVGDTGPRSSMRKIRKLERYLTDEGLLNTARPTRMPHGLYDANQMWWVKETFRARRVMVPTPDLDKSLGLKHLDVWISDPVQCESSTDEWDWTGSFLYLPTVHFDTQSTYGVISGCSALQFVMNAAKGRNLYECDFQEPLGRRNCSHPVEKLANLGAIVSDSRQLQSLYYVRYITNEQVYAPSGVEQRVNDIVGYPIYIAFG
jgi:hypothetical protein